MYVSVMSTEEYPTAQGKVFGDYRLIKNKKEIKHFALYIVSAFEFDALTKMPNLPVRGESK